MAAAKKNTALSVVVVAVVAYLAYKFLPSLLSSLRAGGGGYAGTVGSSGSSNPLAQFLRPNPGQGAKPNINGGNLSIQRGNPAANAAGFGQWLYNTTRDITLGQPGELNPGNFGGVASYDTAGLDALSIPLNPLQTLDNLPTTNYADPNILSGADLSSLVGGTYGPDANGTYSVGGTPDLGGIQTVSDPSADNFAFDSSSFSAGDGGGAGYTSDATGGIDSGGGGFAGSGFGGDTYSTA